MDAYDYEGPLEENINMVGKRTAMMGEMLQWNPRMGGDDRRFTKQGGKLDYFEYSHSKKYIYIYLYIVYIYNIYIV